MLATKSCWSTIRLWPAVREVQGSGAVRSTSSSFPRPATDRCRRARSTRRALAAEDSAPQYRLSRSRRAAGGLHVLHVGHDRQAQGGAGVASGHRAAFDRQRRGRHAGRCERDIVQAVVPMFHANAWGLPFTCMMVGAKQVFPARTSIREACSNKWRPSAYGHGRRADDLARDLADPRQQSAGL